MSATVAILAMNGASTGKAQDAPRGILPNPAAGRDLSQPGGARRLSGDVTAAFRAALTDGPVWHVILLIGDGMGDSEITIARNYAEGAGGFFKGIDALPVTGQYTHYALDRETGKPDYVTDSAASATAWATGTKSYNGAISVDIRGRLHATLLELARTAGYATGNVSTAELQDATPAALMAHVSGRRCYAPIATTRLCPDNTLEQGGAGSITEQMLNTRPDVMLGGGAASFTEQATAGTWKGQSLRTQAEARGFRIVETLEALDAVTVADPQAPLLGLFADGNMPVRWSGPRASLHGNLQAEPVTCQPNPLRTARTPSLAWMTARAIQLLQSNAKGFLLQVEGASIDKQDHAANPCGQIGETVDLDEAVQVALDFARTHADTLVIVTADHAHSSQIIPSDSRAPGLTQALRTRDGSVMAVGYATSESGSQEHTGSQLRVAAYGPRAANVTGLTDQTDLFYTIRDALQLMPGAD